MPRVGYCAAKNIAKSGKRATACQNKVRSGELYCARHRVIKANTIHTIHSIHSMNDVHDGDVDNLDDKEDRHEEDDVDDAHEVHDFNDLNEEDMNFALQVPLNIGNPFVPKLHKRADRVERVEGQPNHPHINSLFAKQSRDEDWMHLAIEIKTLYQMVDRLRVSIEQLSRMMEVHLDNTHKSNKSTKELKNKNKNIEARALNLFYQEHKKDNWVEEEIQTYLRKADLLGVPIPWQYRKFLTDRLFKDTLTSEQRNIYFEKVKQ